jgi:hypothetical protein
MTSLHISSFFFQFLGTLTGRVSMMDRFYSAYLQQVHIWLASGGNLYTHLVQQGAVSFRIFLSKVSFPIWSVFRLLKGSMGNRAPCLGRCCCLDSSSSSSVS